MPRGLPPSNDIISVIGNLERRVRLLEAKPTGKAEYYNSESGGSEIGRRFKDAEGNILYADSESAQGLIYPHDMTQWIVPVYQTLTTSTFATIVESEIIAPACNVIFFGGALIVPSGTTAEVRIWDFGTGTAYGTQSAVGPVNNFQCNWLHPYKTGWGSSGSNAGRYSTARLQYQVRVTSGAGPVYAYTPRSLMIRSSRWTVGESETTPFSFT